MKKTEQDEMIYVDSIEELAKLINKTPEDTMLTITIQGDE